MNAGQEEIVEIWLSEPQTAVLESRQQLILEMAGQGGGKSQNIGYSSCMLISEFPEALGFIGANTYLQLSQSTLDRVFKTWKQDKGYEEWDAKTCPWGAYVVDKKPPPHFTRLHKLRKYEGTISFFNGCLIFIGSLENYKAHEGKEFAWAHLDETKDTKENALKEVILGRLRQYGLWFDQAGGLHFDNKIKADQAQARGWNAWNPLYIHTSPALGGVDWLNKMFQLDKFAREIKDRVTQREKDFFYREFDNKAVCIYSAYHNAANLAPNFLQNQEANLGDEESILKLVHGYPFSKSGGEYYPAFRRDWHVGKVPYIPGLPVSTSWDFNVVPYMTCLCIQLETLIRFMDPLGKKHDDPVEDREALEVTRIRVYKEYCFGIPRNSVEAIGEQFGADHDPAITEVDYFGDAMGLNRIEGLGSQTRFKWVEDALWAYLHNSSKKVKNPNVTPLRRRDLLNDILRGKYPNIEIIIDESCVNTITDLEHVKQGVKGKHKPKTVDTKTGASYELLGHTSDALEYYASEAFKFLIKQE